MIRKRNKIIGLIVIVIIVIFVIYQSLELYNTESNPTGILRGTVILSPLTSVCSPTGDPPCSRPYENYEFEIYSKDGKTIISKITTDENGKYEIILNQGNYAIYTKQSLIFDKINWSEPTKISIENNQTLVIDIHVDTGIR